MYNSTSSALGVTSLTRSGAVQSLFCADRVGFSLVHCMLPGVHVCCCSLRASLELADFEGPGSRTGVARGIVFAPDTSQVWHAAQGQLLKP